MNNKAMASQMCVSATSIKVTLKVAADYVFDEMKPAYKFDIIMYNRCGDKGNVKSIKFEDALEFIDGM